MDYKEKYEQALEKARVWKEKSGMPKNKQGILDDIFPELKESEDERISKKIIKYLEQTVPHNHRDEVLKSKEWIAWLEKQGEQKPIIEMKSAEESLGISSEKYNDIINDCLYGEQKPADRVEPKFQNGQWIVWQNKCYKVNYNGCGYELIDQNGLRTSLEYGTVDKSAHLWTIQDAKDGDIISSPSHHLIWIYKDKEHYHACVNMNCVTDNFFINGLIIVPNDVCPATKNEKNILFASMIEAGYEWNAEKKELKKNNSYCKEHCKGYQETGKCFADGDCKDKREAERKSTWSEDDEYKLNMCITAIETYYKWDSMVDWLKSLKQRIGG